MDVRDVLALTPNSSVSRKRSLRPPEPPSFSSVVRANELKEPENKNPRMSSKVSKSGSSDPDSIPIFLEPAVIPRPETKVSHPEPLEIEEDLGTVGEDDITESTVRKLTVLLEKRILANQEARTKFPDQPTKFMDSEIELQETLESMQILAAKPSLYNVLAAQVRPIHLLLNLLSHENTDISVNIVDLLNELLKPDGLREAGAEAVNPLIDLLFSNQLVHLLTQNLARLDESVKDEAEGVHTTLGIIESLLDVRPDLAVAIAQQGIFAWILRRIQRRTFDKNKLYVSEVLAILLQLDDANKTRLGEMDGIDILLQQLAVYKRHDPSTREEAEMMYNLFDCLCSSLMLAGNKDKFLKGEGVQLMNLMLRERHAARDCALKVLDYALSVVSSPATSNAEEGLTEDSTFLSEGEAAAAANCNKFVEVLGLRTLFPLFMHSPQARGLKLAAAIKEKSLPGPTASEMEEHIISIVASLLRHCTGQQQSRVLSKFMENEHEKVDRMVELHFKYYERVQESNLKVERFRQRLLTHPEITPEEVEEAVSIKRMDSGLLSLQLVDISLLGIFVNGQPSVRSAIRRLLKMRSASLSQLINVAQDYADNLGDTKDSMTHEKSRVLNLIRGAREHLA
ncbi:Beta-catenin-like protein 1 [Sparganum proliferum]